MGVVIDWGNGRRSIDVPDTFSPRQTPDRFGSGFAGVAGYNWQSGSIVHGIEIDAGTSTIEPRMTFLSRKTSEAIHIYTTYDYMATLRARLGYALPAGWLLFGTAGSVLIHYKSHIGYTVGVAPDWGPAVDDDTVDHWQLGFSAGAGVEKTLGEHFAARLEWQHLEAGFMDFDYSLTTGVHTSASVRSDVGRLGLAYRW
jgi:opacity protein-like surface antigen